MKHLLPTLLLAAATAGSAHAGQNCEHKPMSVEDVERSLSLAQRSMQVLDDSGAQVAIIARAGQDLSQYGLRYSHVGLAWRDNPAGRWVVVQLLNDCGTANSALYNDGLGNFFLSGVFRYQAQLILPSPEVQQRLVQVLASRTPVRMHEPHYSMLSYAWSTRYQNSNQWALETLAAASAPAGRVETRAEAQKWLNGAGYRPAGIDVGLGSRVGVRLFRANVAFDDHPTSLRIRGHFETVTVDGIEQFVRSYDSGARVIEL
ncbi:DUF2145 domain-containing protein [Pseudoduganella violaceinigra]|uniref:DUF2145 domain-containing protein n=1 Tax=Pseudoduganella violaceinigra TaxID=246602 RepID=UPI0004015DDA|nr:DUF2145 domain-containing protein [Pseudoduganella violaceinigra]